MVRLMKLLIVLATAAVLLAACGGSDDKGDSKSSTDKSESTKGYFGEAQSDAINPALAQWNKAIDDGVKNADSCNALADRLYKKGASGTAIVACHRKETGAVLAAIDELQQVVDGKLDGDWRPECDKAIEDVSTSLDQMEADWKAYDADWVAYAKGKPTPKVEAHGKATDRSRDKWINEDIPMWTKACYTQKSIDDAAKERAKDSSTTSTSKDDDTDS